MHLGRFHAAIDMIDAEFRDKKVLEVLNAVISQLNSSASNPGSPEQAKAFRDSYQQLRLMLEESEINKAHPLRRAIFDEIGALRFVGIGFLESVEHIISSNNVAPALAVQELQKLVAEATTFQQVIASINQGFTELKVEYELFEENEGEIGISIPRPLITSEFSLFIKELKQYSFAFNALNEVVSANDQPLTLKTISSSDWQFYLLAAPVVLKVISYTMKDIADILRSLVEIKKNVTELLGKGVPEVVIAPVRAYGDEMLDTKFRELAEKLIAEHYTKDDDARRKELTNYLSQSLKFIAQRIDVGVKVDIRICPPEKPPADPTTPDGAENLRLYEERKAFAEDVNRQTLLVAEMSATKGETLQLVAPNLDGEEVATV